MYAEGLRQALGCDSRLLTKLFRCRQSVRITDSEHVRDRSVIEKIRRELAGSWHLAAFDQTLHLTKWLGCIARRGGVFLRLGIFSSIGIGDVLLLQCSCIISLSLFDKTPYR